MKTKSILNAIKKTGLKLEISGNTYSVTNGNTLLRFHDQGGQAICLSTKPVDNHGDTNPFNSNCYTSYWSSMKVAIEQLVKAA